MIASYHVNSFFASASVGSKHGAKMGRRESEAGVKRVLEWELSFTEKTLHVPSYYCIDFTVVTIILNKLYTVSVFRKKEACLAL